MKLICKILLSISVSLLVLACNKDKQASSVDTNEYENASTAESADTCPNVWLEIDTAQFARNIEYLKEIVATTTDSLSDATTPRICVVMKGDAYGNGIATLMPVVIREGIEDVAITSNQEARDARRSGYKGRLMRIRLATEKEVGEGIRLGIDELVGSLEQAQYINKVAQEEGKTVRFWLAVNAGGMSRNGIELSTHEEDALKIMQLTHLQCIGMMTHYPENKDEKIREQLITFQHQTSQLIGKAHLERSKLTLSTAATYATLYLPETRLDMVRVGSALYNYGYTEKYNRFKKIMSFKSTVTSIQDYPEGNTVSYKRTHTLTRPSRLANIPIGYANGLSTNCSNRAYFLIRGHRCPVVGNVTMNITMVDITDFPDIQEGDEVVIYGRQKNEEITADSISSWSGSNLLSQSMFWAAANPKKAAR